MLTTRNTIVNITSNNTNGFGNLVVSSQEKIKKIVFIIEEKKFFEKDVDDKLLKIDFKVDNVVLWTLDKPYTYNYNLSITYHDGKEEIVEGRFGFRKVGQNGNNITLNGQPIFVKGYIRGATAHEHCNLTNLTESDYYRKNIRQAKKFGFNFIRFHSVVPNESFFNVADEEGILVQLEMRMPNDNYNNLEEMVGAKKELISNSFIEKIINEKYNHPSLAVYCIGNEIRNLSSGNRVNEIGELIKEKDRTRLFLDTCAWGENGRNLVDIDVQHMGYYFPFGKHYKMYDSTDNLLVVGSVQAPIKSTGENSSCKKILHYKVPLIAHEVCHYTALRDFKTLRKKFAYYGQKEPWWIDEELKMIKAKGFEENYEETFKASKYFQAKCWKVAFERLRSSKILGGFQFLQFADTNQYENSNGIVDCFDDITYIQPEEFLKVNGDLVLTSSINGRLFYENTCEEITFSTSCFDDKVNEFADFSYNLVDDNGNSYASGTLKHLDVIFGKTAEICKVEIRLPKLEKSTKLKVRATLVDDDNVIATNEWDIWVYKRFDKLTYSDFTKIDDEIVITDDVEKALNRLNENKKVCLIYRSDFTRHILRKDTPNPKYAFKSTWNRFKPVIWDRGTNYGGLNDINLLNKYGFATDRYYDFNLSVLTEDCDKIILDDFPVKPKVLISGIDKNVRDRFDAYKDSFNLPELMYDRTLRDFGYLFELKVGGGKLLVCGMNMLGLDEDEPSTKCMAEFIKRYMKSNDFNPDRAVSVKELTNYMINCSLEPVKERIMTQFWELDNAPVESQEFWQESRRYLK